MARSNLVTLVFLWEKVKNVDFSETIEACDFKIGKCRQLNELMTVYVSIEGQGHLHMKIKTCFSQKSRILYVNL